MPRLPDGGWRLDDTASEEGPYAPPKKDGPKPAPSKSAPRPVPNKNTPKRRD